MEETIQFVMYRMLKNILVILLFLLITSFFLRGLFFSPGTIVGADWGFPLTAIQVSQDIPTTSWTNHNNFLGARQSYLAGLPFQMFLKIFTAFGIGSDFYTKFLLIFVFVIAGFSMYSLAKFFRMNEAAAFLSGLFFITSPVFFNYSIMGWFYVLFASALLPFAVKFFIKSVERNKTRDAIITSIIYAISIVSAQSAFVYPIVFLILGLYLVKDRRTFLSYIRSFTLVVFLFFLLNSHWILGLLIFPDRQIVGTSLVNSGASLGTVAHMIPINILRLFGSLYNYQYEKIMDSSPLSVTSFIITLFAIIPLLLSRKKKLVLIIWLIALVPALMYLLNLRRDIFLYIPMSNVIRDFARFAVLSIFSYALLAGFFFDYLFEKVSSIKWFQKKFLIIPIVSLSIWIVSIFPWWTGEITNWQPGGGCFDIRLRTKVIPDEFLEVEKKFNEKKLDHKGIHIPLGAIVEFKDDLKFKGICNGLADAFASFSPVSGGLGVSDRNQGYTDWYSKRIVLDALKEDIDVNITDILKPTNIKYFIIRKNFLSGDNKVLNDISRKIRAQQLKSVFDGKKVSVFSLLDTDFLPHLYTARLVNHWKEDLDDLPKLFSSPNYEKRSAVYLDQFIREKSKKDLIDILPKDIRDMPVLEFKKIDMTKYRVRVHSAKNIFPLVFSESFHDGWRAYIVQSAKFKLRSPNLVNYRIIKGNENDQVGKEEINTFIDKGWISTLGEVNNRIDFISKNFQDTIQNNNLPNGNFYETWFKKSISEKEHLIVNSYANSWIIDTTKICNNGNICERNSDGSYNFELILEFWPQRLFYIGIMISSLCLFGCLLYLSLVKDK